MDLLVRIQDITENKLLQYEGDHPMKKMDELQKVVGEQKREVHYQFNLTRSGRFLLVKGAVEGTLVFDCDRCLEPFDFPQQEKFRVTLLPAESQRTLFGDQDMSEEELEVGIYQGECLDLKTIMEEQILLGIPMKKICSDTCRGICSQCGNNLNVNNCSCSPPDNSDHPFAGLRQ
ncbi:MAG: DUF177 domain-containing protein [SAR324 cluster bacterium]|nr:DUF177 domain-containing protein [SAR324 cluster bacterium]